MTAIEEFQRACRDFGISVDDALKEKILELRLRMFLKCLPDPRIKEHEVVKFLHEALGRDPDERLLESVRLSPRGPKLSEDEVIDIEQSQNGRCAVCGRLLDRSARMHVDHILPVVFGGKSNLENYQLLCFQCNLGKGKLLSWIMAAPFFVDGGDSITTRLRFCVLSYHAGRCSLEKCDASARNTEMSVTPKIPRSRGGRLIFDNLTAVCRDCLQFLERSDYERAKRAVLGQRWNPRSRRLQ